MFYLKPTRNSTIEVLTNMVTKERHFSFYYIYNNCNEDLKKVWLERQTRRKKPMLFSYLILVLECKHQSCPL